MSHEDLGFRENKISIASEDLFQGSHYYAR